MNITVKEAFVAMTDYIGEVLSEGGFEFEALKGSLAMPEGQASLATGWPVWTKSVEQTIRGMPPRASFAAPEVRGGETHRLYDFECDHLITVEDAFTSMAAYVNIFASTAGEDSLTLFGDTEIEADGGPFDAAAWDDWLDAVRQTSG